MMFAIVCGAAATSRSSSKSQVESRALLLPHVTPNSHEGSEHFRQRLPVIRPAQMGYRRRICSKRQRRTLTVRAKLRRSVTPPNHQPLPHPPITTPPAQQDGEGRVQQVCLSISGQRLAFSFF